MKILPYDEWGQPEYSKNSDRGRVETQYPPQRYEGKRETGGLSNAPTLYDELIGSLRNDNENGNDSATHYWYDWLNEDK